MMGPPPVQGILQSRAIAQLIAHATALRRRAFWQRTSGSGHFPRLPRGRSPPGGARAYQRFDEARQRRKQTRFITGQVKIGGKMRDKGRGFTPTVAKSDPTQ
jgi:hypothetical protein